jgi:hypothetical protein
MYDWSNQRRGCIGATTHPEWFIVQERGRIAISVRCLGVRYLESSGACSKADRGLSTTPPLCPPAKGSTN